MKWLSRRININPETWEIMTKLKLRKADFIRSAIIEKLERDFIIKDKIPF
jgi:hypothetical protein